jgi:sialic acid synthase SpsE
MRLALGRVLGALTLLAGCSDSESGPLSRAPASIEEAAKEAGCDVVKYEPQTQNLFNMRSAKCTGDARVYWFPTEEANTNHGEMCKQMGGKAVTSGKNWTKYSPSC